MADRSLTDIGTGLYKIDEWHEQCEAVRPIGGHWQVEKGREWARVGACAWEFLLACPYGVENMLQHFERFDWHLIGPVYCIYGQKRIIWRGVPGKSVKGCSLI